MLHTMVIHKVKQITHELSLKSRVYAMLHQVTQVSLIPILLYTKNDGGLLKSIFQLVLLGWVSQSKPSISWSVV